MNETVEFLKAIADETRLAIIAELKSSDSYVEKLAENLSLTPATVCYHLKKMEKARSSQLPCLCRPPANPPR